MEKVKIINEHKFGAAFELMCLAVGGAIIIDSIIKWNNHKKFKERIKLIETANKAIKTRDEWLKKYDKNDVKETEENENGES